jgi:hypothetical protein
LAQLLGVFALGAQGSGEAIKDQMKQWGDQ